MAADGERPVAAVGHGPGVERLDVHVLRRPRRRRGGRHAAPARHHHGAVEARAGGTTGPGCTYGEPAVASLITGTLSAHCAPALSAHAFCAVERLRHLEYLHDHVRMESLVSDGVPGPDGGVLRPDPGRPGLGLAVRWAEAERHRVHCPAPRV